MSRVEYVSGEPVKVEEVTSFVDRLIEGSDIHTIEATDRYGNTATGTAFDKDTATDNAIFKVSKNW